MAGLPQSPQLNETVASGLSSGSLSVETLEEVGLEEIDSGSLSVETLEEVGLEEIDAVPQEGRVGEGRLQN